MQGELEMIIEFLKVIFFPEVRCLFCGQTVDYNGNQNIHDICSKCNDQLEMIEPPYCKSCHRPLPNVQIHSMNDEISHQSHCEDCLAASTSSLTQNRSAVIYNDFMKEMLALYKYRGKESLAEVFSFLLKIAYDAYFEKTKIDLITYIPLHPKRLVERGFNQAEQLAIGLNRLTELPIYPLLIRVKETAKQSKTGKQERKKQLEGAFEINGSYIHIINGKNILIIDDIYTTGATLQEVAKILVEDGAKTVNSLTLARATFSQSIGKDNLPIRNKSS